MVYDLGIHPKACSPKVWRVICPEWKTGRISQIILRISQPEGLRLVDPEAIQRPMSREILPVKDSRAFYGRKESSLLAYRGTTRRRFASRNALGGVCSIMQGATRLLGLGSTSRLFLRPMEGLRTTFDQTCITFRIGTIGSTSS